MRALEQLDFNSAMALALFQGWKSTGGYEVEIQRITRQDETVFVYARFIEPGAGMIVTGEITSPYHVVVVEKPPTRPGSATFKIYSGNTPLFVTEKQLP